MIVRRILVLQPGPRRWPFAIRAALCISAPVAAGLAAGDLPSGLLASIGAFTALYGSGRPYLNRALQLAVIAVCFAVFVTVGDMAATVPLLGVLTVAVVATLAVLVCNALVVGPPGAYMFVLACAAGTGVATEHLSPWRTGLLVLAGGAFAWTVHMAGALGGFRRPERRAIAAAAEATAGYAESIGTDAETAARHRAADALHRAWQVLVNFQPARPGRRSLLPALRARTLRLHVLFAELMAAAAGQGSMPADAARKARGLAGDDPSAAGVDADQVPLGRPGAAELLRRAVAPGSLTFAVAVRTGIAACVAGLIASTLGLDHSYWAAAAAVLVLHQGFDWQRTLQRTAQRVLGTGAGLVLAGVTFALHPQGVWLVLMLAALQFTVEILVVRNYAFAVVFITPLALTIASSGHRVDNLTGLLVARGVDTVIGCTVAVLVYLVMARRHTVTRLDDAVAQTLEAAAGVATHLAQSVVDSQTARADRRDLQVRLIAMVSAYDAGAGGSRRERSHAQLMWPAVVATQDVAYRILAACWAIEHGEISDGRRPFDPVGESSFSAALIALADAVRTSSPPATLGELPAFGAEEIARLRDSLIQDRE